MNLLQIIFLALSLGGFSYGFYCQVKARKCISKEKIQELKDTSIIASGVMPPKEIISDEGLKYCRGFNLGVAIFIGSIVLLTVVSCLK